MVAGREVSPSDVEKTQRLKAWWLTGAGSALWVDTDKPWTHLRDSLIKLAHMSPEMATQVASRWFIERFGYAAGSDKNRVVHGKPPRGKVVGPG